MAELLETLLGFITRCEFNFFFFISDDLIIAPDFYMYFLALRHLLNSDPTIMCISAYNDNGKPEHINDQQNGSYLLLLYHSLI